MLYATTRSDHDTYTQERALKEPCAPDGGLYIPMRWSRMSRKELAVLMKKSPTGILASVMNHFFSCKLTDRDIEFHLGKSWIQLRSMSHRITVAEVWRNMDGDFSWIQRRLVELVAIDKRQTPVGEWMQVATRIALLMCAYSEMIRQEQLNFGEKLDITVLSGDFSGPMAGWYARQMGLPIGNIIICCNENNAVWELMQRGEMRTDLLVRKTNTPRCDVACPRGLERLVRGALGLEEACRYVACREKGGVFQLNGEQHARLSDSMFASVVSDRRLPRVIANTYATNGYILCPYSALAYSGLMDYRSSTGRSGPALMICEHSPLQCEDAIAKAMGIPVPQLHERLDIVI